MHKDHRERLRKRFLNAENSLEKHEMLELLLTFSIPRKNTNDIAHNLLDKFGNFSAIFDAPINALTSVEGIGLMSAIFIKVISNMIRFYNEDKNKQTNNRITKEEIGNIVLNKFIGRAGEENIALVLMDSKMRLLFCDIVGHGNFQEVNVYNRDLARIALQYNAKYAILAHNHPSGIALPSKDDINTTIVLRNLLKDLGIILLDHFIISDNDYVALADTELRETIFK